MMMKFLAKNNLLRQHLPCNATQNTSRRSKRRTRARALLVHHLLFGSFSIVMRNISSLNTFYLVHHDVNISWEDKNKKRLSLFFFGDARSFGSTFFNSSLATGEFARNLGLCAFSLLDLFVYPFLSEVLIHILYVYSPASLPQITRTRLAPC